ncbi:MAG: hypothetical protein Q9198_004187 [Flavoplaca austrocitrina]
MGVSVVLETVLGSTGSSINALSAADDTGCFAYCAGSIVVLTDVNSLAQRFFYANPDALPAQITPSYYNPATPTKATGNRALAHTPYKENSLSSIALCDSSVDYPGKGKLSHRPRSVTCVALSPCGNYLAVGEVRTCLTEHTFGVQAIAFSADSRWLCSLGDIHDGGLFLWSINQRTGALKLDSSNRCTTANTIVWMGNNVITVGTRHVKVWRFEQPLSTTKYRRGLDSASNSAHASPVPRTFTGRNVLLGALKDAVFTCAVAIRDDAAVLCTQDGAVCLLDDAHRSQRLFQVTKRECSIASITLDPFSKVVWLGGKGGEPEALPLSSFFAVRDPSTSSEQLKNLDLNSEQKGTDCLGIYALCYADKRLVSADSRSISLYGICLGANQTLEASVVQRLPAHKSAVIGVVVSSNPTITDFKFLTYSEKGHILYWSWDGSCIGSCTVPLDLPLVPEANDGNELRVVRHLSTINMLLSGDKTGVLRLLHTNGKVKAAVWGHDGEMHDLAVQVLDDNQLLAASSGRDRTIQLFRISKTDCSLEQSLINEHAGPIRQIEFAQNGSILVSISSDRTLVIHQRVSKTDDSVAFVSTRTIHLKASPTSMTLSPHASSDLLLSTMDRCVRWISVPEANTMQVFKTADHSNGEPVILSRVTAGTLDRHSSPVTVLAGYSSADGSIRLYEVETGSLLALIQGQNAVSGLAFVQISETGGDMKTKLVSTGGSDGTIMLWNIVIVPQDETKHQKGDGSSDTYPSRLNPPSSIRLVRRVLSRAEIANFHRSLKEQNNNKNSLSPLRYAISDYSEAPKIASSHDQTGRDAVPGRQVKRASPPLSPKVTLRSWTRRSSLDERHQHIVTKHTDNIDTTAKQIANTLHEFRNGLGKSQESLSTNSAQTLKRQLKATLDVLEPSNQPSDRIRDRMGSESFDDYLADMIDKRLALQSRKEGQADAFS